ncbi:hypothetical protein C922_05006 [Plasmodium inui San Antonio 1]|uniref:Uncharacterized protein n=1 Tax=Plasmodium inui San Antonio 1 TaxID=1237626 RepID=W7AH48_9APIC|nr:hypothetical protein C922_05006 [Plasmodium inui San Antonio 1]EUD64591.1 hypothetical protein C922_05006 [Plasmodium inui San Antonio 1]
MSNMERLKQRLEESLQKHKNRLLKTRHKKAKWSMEEKGTKSTNYTGEEPNKIEKAKNETADSGRVKTAATGREKHPNIYDRNNLKSRLIERLGNAKVPQVKGKKERNTVVSGPLKDKLHCKANSSRSVIREGRGTSFRDGKTNRDGVAKGVIPHQSEPNHAVEDDTMEEHHQEGHVLEERALEDGNFDGVSKEIRDNLNDLFRHFINCKIKNLYVIHGDGGKVPRGEFAEEGRGVMMIPGVGESKEVQKGFIGQVAAEKKQLGVASPDVDEVGCENDAKGEEEGLYSHLCHVRGGQSNFNGEGVANGVSQRRDTRKETQMIGASIRRGGKNASMIADGRVVGSSEFLGTDIGSESYKRTFVKLMQIKKKIKKKIEKFEDGENRLFGTDKRTMCTSDASNEERNLSLRDISTFTDGNVSSAKGINHWGVVQVDSSVASAASTNQEVSSTGESIELFTTQKNIFVCNYYTKKSRRSKDSRRERKEGEVHLVSDAANFLGSAFSLASHSTAMCEVGKGQLNECQPAECYSAEYEGNCNPHKQYASSTYGRDYRRKPTRKGSTQVERVTQGRGSHVNRIPDQRERRQEKRRDYPGKTKYELSSCPSSSLSYQGNFLSPSRRNAFKCLRGEVRRGLSTHMGRQSNDEWSRTGERYAKWNTRDRGREPHYASENRPLGPEQSATCEQEGAKCEMRSVMQCEMNMCNKRSVEKEGVNRFPIWCWPSEKEGPYKGGGVQPPPPVQWNRCSSKFSPSLSGESVGHCFVELNGQYSRPGDGPRERAPLSGNRTNTHATHLQLTRSAHHSCDEQAKCYICSFPIRNSEEEFILKRKKKDYHVGRLHKEDTYRQKECTSIDCLNEADLLYRRNRCEVSHLAQGGYSHGEMIQRDIHTHKRSTNSERGILRSRQTIHGDSGKLSYMADQEGEPQKMETPERYIEIRHMGVDVHPSEDKGPGNGTNWRYPSGEEDEKEQEKKGQQHEPPFVNDSSDLTYGGKWKGEESHKREEAIWDGEGFSLQTSIHQGGVQRNIPTCAVKRNDGLDNTGSKSQWRNSPLRVALHEGSCARKEPTPPVVAPRDVDHFSEPYNTWVYKERVSASAEREGVSIESGIVNESTRGRKPKTRFWNISEGDTFNFPVEGSSGKVLQLGGLLEEGPAERHQGFGTEGGINRRRAPSNGAILKKVLRMKIEAMRGEKGNMGGQPQPGKVTPPMGLAQGEPNAHNIPDGERKLFRGQGQGGIPTHREAKQTDSGNGEGWVRDKLFGQMGGANVGGPSRSRGTFTRGTLNGASMNGDILNRIPLNNDPPSRLPPRSRVEKDAPREIAAPVGSPKIGACSLRSTSTLERIPSSRHTHRRYSLRSALTRKAPITVKQVGTEGPRHDDNNNRDDDDKDDDDKDDGGNDDDNMEVQRFNESYYCNLNRIKSDDVYPNSEEPISTSEKRSLMKAYLQDVRKKKRKEETRKVFNYNLKYNIEFFKFAQLICQDNRFCSNYLGHIGTNVAANGDDIDRIAFSIVRLFNGR